MAAIMDKKQKEYGTEIYLIADEPYREATEAADLTSSESVTSSGITRYPIRSPGSESDLLYE